MKYKFEITIDDIEDIRYDFIEDCIRDCLTEDEEVAIKDHLFYEKKNILSTKTKQGWKIHFRKKDYNG